MHRDSYLRKQVGSGTTGNTEPKEFNFIETAALKIGIVVPSFVVLELLEHIGFRDLQNTILH